MKNLKEFNAAVDRAIMGLIYSSEAEVLNKLCIGGMREGYAQLVVAAAKVDIKVDSSLIG